MQNTNESPQLNLESMLEAASQDERLTGYSNFLDTLRQALPEQQLDLPAPDVRRGIIDRIERLPIIGQRLKNYFYGEVARAASHRAHAQINDFATYLEALKRIAIAYTTSADAQTHNARTLTDPLVERINGLVDVSTLAIASTIPALSSQFNAQVTDNALAKYRDELELLAQRVRMGYEGTLLSLHDQSVTPDVVCMLSKKMPKIPVQLANDPNIYDLNSLITSVNSALTRGRAYVCPSAAHTEGADENPAELLNVRSVITSSTAITQAVEQLCYTQRCATVLSVGHVSLDDVIDRIFADLMGDVTWSEDSNITGLLICPISKKPVRIPVQIEGFDDNSVYCLSSMKDIFELANGELTLTTSVAPSDTFFNPQGGFSRMNIHGTLGRRPDGVYFNGRCLFAHDSQAPKLKPEEFMAKVILPKPGYTATQQETMLAAKLSYTKMRLKRGSSRPVIRPL